MQVAIRVDGGRGIGSGHIVRCLALAMALKNMGAEVQFLCAAHQNFQSELVTRHGFVLHTLPVAGDEDARLSLELLTGKDVDWLVVDHYSLGADWERRMREVVGRILVVEDVANRPHDADILLDQNLRENALAEYAGLLPENCHLLLGPQYALLRPQFAEARKKCGIRQEGLQRILVFVGGADEHNLTQWILLALADCSHLRMVDVVGGASHLADEALQIICDTHGWNYYRHVDDMASLMCCADLSIGAGGITSWERCSLGLPSLLFVLAKNQEENVRMLAACGAAIELGWMGEAENIDICDLLGGLNKEKLAAMSSASFAVTDGQGAKRVANVLLNG